MSIDRNDFPKEETKNPDEIIVRDIDTFHMEMMDDGFMWIGLIRKDGQIDHLNIVAKGDKLSVMWTPRTGHINPNYGESNETI